MDKSDTISELAKALVKAQAAIQPAIKDKTNPAFRSRYADLTAVWDACRGALTSNGLSIVQMPIDAEAGRVALTTMLLHISGEYISSTVSTALVKNDPQGVGSALTYLRRYALSAMVGVVADEDDDGNAASRPQANGAAAYSPPAPKPSTPAPAPAQSAGRRDLMDRAMTLYGVMKEQGLKYKGKMFKDMDIPELGQAIATMEKQLSDSAEWEEIDEGVTT
jgi:hypothetical protein